MQKFRIAKIKTNKSKRYSCFVFPDMSTVVVLDLDDVLIHECFPVGLPTKGNIYNSMRSVSHCFNYTGTEEKKDSIAVSQKKMAKHVCIKSGEGAVGKGKPSAAKWAETAGNVYVGRANHWLKIRENSKFANPFKVDEYGLDLALEYYNDHIHNHDCYHSAKECRKATKTIASEHTLAAQAKRELVGLNLGCMCLSNARCHAKILAELVN